jgi:hydrogenase maturation protease
LKLGCHRSEEPMRILVAGIGNVLRGDDAFGVRALQAFADDAARPADVATLDTGIGGIHLVQELMQGYDALIVFDACDRASSPGQIFVLEPDLPDITALSETEKRDYFCETHYATPVRALTFARELGVLPSIVRIIGCQIANADDFHQVMHPAVDAAIEPAVSLARQIVQTIRSAR